MFRKLNVCIHALCRMLEEFEMELVLRQNFYDFFAEHREHPDNSGLMYRMQAFDKSTVRVQGII